MAACSPGGLGASKNGPYAPGVATRGEAVDGLIVGNRLIEAGEYELALDAFTRAALEHGMTVDVLSGLKRFEESLNRKASLEA